MQSRKPLALVAVLAAFAAPVLPAEALAQSSGDEQYEDPFGANPQEEAPQQSPSQEAPAEPAPAPLQPSQAPESAQAPETGGNPGSALPRTGLPALPIAIAGLALLAAGGLIRRRA